MKIIYNKIFPLPGFKSFNFCGILFTRSKHLTEIDINHEEIHTEQMIELFYIFFYLIYIIEWLIRFLFTKDRFSKLAYKNISFEKEAYTHQEDMNYVDWRRKSYAMWRK